MSAETDLGYAGLDAARVGLYDLDSCNRNVASFAMAGLILIIIALLAVAILFTRLFSPGVRLQLMGVGLVIIPLFAPPPAPFNVWVTQFGAGLIMLGLGVSAWLAHRANRLQQAADKRAAKALPSEELKKEATTTFRKWLWPLRRN